MDENAESWHNTSNFYITTISDFSFVVDIVINFITAYHREDFRLETRPKFIAISYMFGGFFLIDFVSAIPLELIIKSEGEEE